MAGITDKFSFAYIQEAFVAALLAIARQSDGSSGGRKRESARPALTEQLDDDWLGVVDVSGDEDLKKLVLWVEIKKQIEILREGMEQETATSA